MSISGRTDNELREVAKDFLYSCTSKDLARLLTDEEVQLLQAPAMSTHARREHARGNMSDEALGQTLDTIKKAWA